MQNSRHVLAPYIVLIISGFFFGAVAGDSFTPVFGAIVGYLLADNIWLKKRLAGLERTIFPQRAKAAAPADFSADAAVPPPAAAEAVPLAAAASPGRGALGGLYSTSSPPGGEAGQSFSQAASPESGRVAEIFHRMFAALKNFFTTGNIILKIGLIILFFGVSFLLKYAAQRNLVPIELRLTAVCLGGIAMLAIGWRLRLQRRLYGLLLQGGGVGILYLTVFAAAKLYHLLPFALAFGVMLAIVLLAGALAVLQDEKWLAVAGSSGGFLAPVLLSTGGGSHVALFSYYLLLNLGILGIAWFRSWRLLNLLGFVFTYVIGSMWGARFYQPAYFASVEPFLLVSFLLYAGVSILFALKQPVELKGYIDPPLVFGLPIITFAMQYGLVHDTEFGLALSAVGFGIFYLLCALPLWRRYQAMGMLVEIYLSFGVVFGSLAIPLALDGYWITAAWALEGAALIWVGVRQNRLRARIFGVLLQLGAGLGFLEALNGQAGTLPVLNGIFLSSLLLAMAGLFSSYYLDIKAKNIRSWERQLVIPLLLWGLCWWFGGGTREIDHFARPGDRMHIFLLFICASSLLMGFTARKLAWRLLDYPPVALLPLLTVLSFNSPFGEVILPHLFAGWGALAWTVALAGQYMLLRISGNKWPLNVVNFYHQLSLWLILYILSAESAWFVGQSLDSRVWSFLCWGVVPAAGILLLGGVGRKLAWPVRRFEQAYLVTGSAVVAAYLCCWCLASLLQSGDPAPLPFLPLINPLEVFELVVLLVSLHWAVQHRRWLADQLGGRVELLVYVAGIIIFLGLNAAVARTVHFFAGVPYLAVDLFHSTVFQAAISILWGLSALSIMVLSTRKMNRHIWMLGGGLLGLVVVKLFLVDLSGTGTIGRIVSFLVVGLLMLLIGYFSPLPPKQEQSA